MKEEIELKLKNDMKYAVKKILEVLTQEPIAIYLSGGYGREEGSWYYDSHNKLCPYNDYDFTVITSERLNIKHYRQLTRSLAKDLNIKWIDITFISQNTIKHLKSTIKNIDLLKGSKLLYGNKDILKNIKLSSTKIGKYDIIELYKTRLWTFLGSWEGEFKDLNEDDSRFFLNQMAKGILAACDLLLIEKKSYTTSYRKRVQIVNKLYPNLFNLKKLSIWAINEKLNPSTIRLTKQEMESLYWDAKDLFIVSLKATFFSNKCDDPYYVKKNIIFNSNYVFKFFYSKYIRKSNYVQKELDLFIAQCFIFYANNKNDININYLIKGSVILKKWGYLESDDLNWNRLRECVAMARNNL